MFIERKDRAVTKLVEIFYTDIKYSYKIYIKYLYKNLEDKYFQEVFVQSAYECSTTTFHLMSTQEIIHIRIFIIFIIIIKNTINTLSGHIGGLYSVHKVHGWLPASGNLIVHLHRAGGAQSVLSCKG